MNFLINFYRDAWTIAVPLTLNLILTLVLAIMGYTDAAIITGNFITPLIVLANVLYIVICDPKNHWRKDSKTNRFKRLISFNYKDKL